MAQILGLKISTNNTVGSNISGVFVVSNHLGYLDIIAYAAVFPIRFTPKSELIWWPIVGWLIALSRPIWLNRSSKQSANIVTKKFKETLENAVSLIVFPEGTTSDGSKGLLRFKSSVFEAPCSGNFPVLPVVISYPGMKREDVCWFGDMTFAPHFWKLLGFSRINVRMDFLEPVYPIGADRKKLAEELYSKMNAKLKETSQS